MLATVFMNDPSFHSSIDMGSRDVLFSFLNASLSREPVHNRIHHEAADRPSLSPGGGSDTFGLVSRAINEKGRTVFWRCFSHDNN
jgi:hypothetical protein